MFTVSTSSSSTATDSLPKNIDIQNISLISLKNALQVIKEPLIPLANLLNIDEKTIDKINIQWNKLLNVKWTQTSNTLEFWNEVASYTDAIGHHTFAESNLILKSNLAIRLLVLPWSNSEVERLFSQINVMKTILRNKMGPKPLDAILTTRAGLKRNSVVQNINYLNRF